MENVKGIKVWVVVGKFDYEGDYLEGSGKVFFEEEDAREYGQSLGGKGYDGYSIKECEVV